MRYPKMRITPQAASIVATLVIWSQVIACDDKAHVDQSRFYGAWFPCLEETCETYGPDGIAFASNRWFYRASYHEAPEEGGMPQYGFDERECCWRYDGERVILDMGDSYQSLWPRFEGEVMMQLKELSYRILDRDVQGWHTHECLEGETFEIADAGEDEDPDPDAWTPEACWTEYWAPLGRAERLLDRHEVNALTFDIDEYIDTF